MKINSRYFAIIVCAIGMFFLAKRLFPKKYRTIHNAEVLQWKSKLNTAYFKGIVYKIGTPERGSQIHGSIYIKLLDSNKLIIPDSCEYLHFKKSFLVLEASHINISTGPHPAIFRNDIIFKNSGSDSVIILSPDGYYKYYFELFDGLIGSFKMH